MQELSLDKFSELENRLISVRKDIDLCCKNNQRSPSEVKLIAVSKGHDFSLIKAAYDLGQRDFGESYAQEMSEKIKLAQTNGLKDIRWHFIGCIQSNKLKLISKADLVHSIASVNHANKLNSLLDKTMPVFLQINLDNDISRNGFKKTELVESLKQLTKFSMLEIKGLMVVLPLSKNANYWFNEVLLIKEEFTPILEHCLLSMGMSADFKEAIACGANYLRIGSNIFGHRPSIAESNS